MANETVHTISGSKKIVSRYLKKCEQKQYYTCGTHYLGPGKKNTCYSSPTYGMANEIGHHISEPNRLSNRFFVFFIWLTILFKKSVKKRTAEFTSA